MTHSNAGRKVLSLTLKYAVPLAISIGLCYLLFTGIDFREMLQIVRDQCDYRWIALGMAISVFSHVFRAMRWRIQLAALGIRPPLFALVLSIFGTYAVNLVFPRLGEVWRTGYISRLENASFATVFGSMVADRLTDTVTVVLLTLLAFGLSSKEIGHYLHTNGETLHGIVSVVSSPWLWLAIGAVVAFVWWFATRKGRKGLMAKAQNALKQLWQGFAVLLTMPGKGVWLLLTCCVWGCYFVQLYAAFYAFPFTEGVLAQYGIRAALVTFVISSISMGVPSNGGIGPWQWAVIMALSIYGVGREQAGAFANLVMGSQTLLLIALGLFTFVCIAVHRHRHEHPAVKNEENVKPT